MLQKRYKAVLDASVDEFQWAPTLGGECYIIVEDILKFHADEVSMGTHPWG